VTLFTEIFKFENIKILTKKYGGDFFIKHQFTAKITKKIIEIFINKIIQITQITVQILTNSNSQLTPYKNQYNFEFFSKILNLHNNSIL